MPQLSPNLQWGELITIIGGFSAVILSLVAVIYHRINKDIANVESDIADAYDKCSELEKLFTSKCDTVQSSITSCAANTAQVATHQVYASEEFERLRALLEEINERLIRMETEHALCFGEYKKRTNQ